MNDEELVKMLDGMMDSGISRLKVEMSDELPENTSEKKYHHGRCDVGSPFATGKLYDFEGCD